MVESRAASFQVDEPKTYKRLMGISFALAGLALGLGAALDQQLVGVGAYAVGMVTGFAIPYLSEFTLFDERDDTIHRQASGTTLTLFGWLAAIVFPSLVVLETTPHFSWGPASWSLAITTAVVYLTFALVSVYYTYQ